MVPPGTLEAVGLVLLRTSAAVLSSPFFGMGGALQSTKIGLIVCITTIVYMTVGEPLPEAMGVWVYGVLAARELLIGFFVGFLFQVVMLAIRIGGELIGHEMGMFMARQVDPDAGVSITLVSRIYENFFLLALLAVNGHHIVLRSITESFSRAPVGTLGAPQSLGAMARDVLGEMFAAGLAFAGPVMILLMLVSILIGILSRAVPQLNIMELSFSLRIVLALVAMFLFAPLLEPALFDLIGRFDSWLGLTLDALES